MFTCTGHTIVTIGRAFGSGGREIGKKVAEELGISFYDKELIEVAAKEGEICAEYLEQCDEKRPSMFFYTMTLNPYTNTGVESLAMIAENLQRKAIKEVAAQGSCVIVGRCANKILANDHELLSVFISAPMEKRIARVAERDGLSEKESKKKIHKADRERRAFYNYYGEGNWGEADSYNLCIDSGDLGTEDAAALIIQYLKLKNKVIG